MSLDRMTKFSWIYDLYSMGRQPEVRENRQLVYQRILEHIVHGFEAKSGSLALSDRDLKSLAIVAGIDLPEGVVGKKVEMGGGVLGWVAKEGVPLLLNGDVSNDARFQRPARNSNIPNSAMCWPLKIEEQVIGALSVNRPTGVSPFTGADLEQGAMMLNLVGLALDNLRLQIEQQRQIGELQEVNRKLEETRNQLLQSEKLASIGQLAAGVAHEINNPIGFVYSNLGSLEKYLQDLFGVLEAYEQAQGDAAKLAEVETLKQKIDLGYLKEDLPALMNESKDGITRVKKIVQDLKDFSHADTSDDWQWADLHKGLDSTLNIAWNEIKYKAEVKKEYGELPEIECYPSQLNQVFMNMLVNAAHAIEGRGTITLRTGKEADQVWVEIADTGKGIPAENLKRIFDPFFTTKPVGTGTGLGLSLSYSIVQKHHGHIDVSSEVGKGTTFRVWLPVRQAEGTA
jgi:signal transduction histidine kinase